MMYVYLRSLFTGRGRRSLGLALGCLLFLLSAGCSRPGAGSGSLTISLPDVKRAQALNARGPHLMVTELDSSTPTLQHLVVNITGSGIDSPIVYIWDGSNGGTPPTSVTLTVPRGSARQIQVLAVYEVDGGHLAFEYGNVQKDIDAAVVPVDVTVASVGGSNGIQGNIMGRYLDANNQGPTDTLGIYFSVPGSNMPPILVQQSEIIAGYFNVFGLSDVNFTYKLGSGRVLFGDTNLSLDPSNPLFANAANSSAVVYVPAVYRPWDHSDTPSENLLFFGYYGPGTAGASPAYQACYDTTGEVTDAFLDADLSTTLNWISSFQPITTLATGRRAGVIEGGSTTCTGAPFTNYLKLTRDHLVNGDEALNEKGPYIAAALNSNFLQFADASGGLQVSWQYAPGTFAASDAIHGTQVFYSTAAGSADGSQPYKNDDNGFDCAALPQFGFIALAPTPVTSAAPQSALIPGLNHQTSVEVILCPYRVTDGKVTYFKHGVDGNPSQMGNSNPPLHVVLTDTQVAIGSPVTPIDSIPANNVSAVTTTIYMQVVDAQNRAVGGASMAGTSFTLALGYNLDTAVLHLDNGDYTDTYSLDANGRFPVQVYANNTEMFTTLSGGYTGNIMGLPNNVGAILPIGPTPGAEPSSISSFGNGVAPVTMVGDCVPIAFGLDNGAGQVPTPSVIDTTFTPSSDAGGSFYLTPDCSGTPATSVTIPAGHVTSYAYFVPTTATFQYISFTGSPQNHDGVTLVPNVKFALSPQSNTPTQAQLIPVAGGSFTAGCNQAQLALQNASSTMIQHLPSTYNLTLTIPSGNALFYSTPNCNGVGSTSTSVILGPNQGSPIYISSSTASLSINVSNGLSLSATATGFPTGFTCGTYKMRSTAVGVLSTDGCELTATNSGTSLSLAASSAIGKGFGEKYYFEYKVVSFSGAGAFLDLGLGNAVAESLNFNSGAYSGNDTNSFAYYTAFPSTANCRYNQLAANGVNLSCNYVGSSDTLGIAVDPQTGGVWILRDGTWQSGASPSGPALFTLGSDMIGHALYPMINVYLPVASNMADVKLVTKGSAMAYKSMITTYGFTPLEP